jgi:hypothetical protein
MFRIGQLQLYSRGSQHARRFYILFAFCLLSFNQSLFWITYSPIASNAKECAAGLPLSANPGGGGASGPSAAWRFLSLGDLTRFTLAFAPDLSSG